MPHDFWLLTGIVALVAFVLFGLTWLLSLRLNNFSFVDVTWSYALAVIAPVYAWLGGGFTSRKLLALTMALLWSLRLGTYLFFRVKKHHPHEDVRYEVLREKWKDSLARSFFFFFQAQAVLIVLLSVPLLLACVNPAPELGIIEWTGFAVWLIGLGGEATQRCADEAFQSRSGQQGQGLSDRPVALFAASELLLRVSRVVGLLALRLRFAVGLGDDLRAGDDFVFPPPCHRHPAHGGMRGAVEGRRLSRVSTHHERLCAVVSEKLNPPHALHRKRNTHEHHQRHPRQEHPS
jgi:steroid 5-alpha reductase family enzyme